MERHEIPKYDLAFSLVHAANRDYEPLLRPGDGSDADVRRRQRLAEMILVFEYDFWFAGDPGPNIRRAICRFCVDLAKRRPEPGEDVQLAAVWLAWFHVLFDHSTDEAYLLAEHVLWRIAPPSHSDLGRQAPWPEMREAARRRRQARWAPTNLGCFDPYERSAYAEIVRWEVGTAVRQGLFAKVDDKEEEEEAAHEDGASRITKALRGALEAIVETADLFTRDEALLTAVRARGHTVETVADLRGVPFAVCDPIGEKTIKAGEAAALVEGASTGMGGLLLAAVDIPAILTINLRFISQIAHTYGYGTSSEVEREFVLNILGTAAATGKLRQAFLANLNRIALEVAVGTAWREIRHHSYTLLLTKVAERTGVRLAKRKIVQAVPLAGAAVCAAINLAYTRNNLVTARMVYRRRRLVERGIRVA